MQISATTKISGNLPRPIPRRIPDRNFCYRKRPCSASRLF